jgi:hypothetical protein
MVARSTVYRSRPRSSAITSADIVLPVRSRREQRGHATARPPPGRIDQSTRTRSRWVARSATSRSCASVAAGRTRSSHPTPGSMRRASRSSPDASCALARHAAGPDRAAHRSAEPAAARPSPHADLLGRKEELGDDRLGGEPLGQVPVQARPLGDGPFGRTGGWDVDNQGNGFGPARIPGRRSTGTTGTGSSANARPGGREGGDSESGRRAALALAGMAGSPRPSPSRCAITRSGHAQRAGQERLFSVLHQHQRPTHERAAGAQRTTAVALAAERPHSSRARPTLARRRVTSLFRYP